MLNINIKVDDNVIINIDEIINFIESLELTDENISSLQNMLNNIRYSNFANKEKLIATISNRLISSKEINTNKDALNELKEQRIDLQNLGIISTKDLDNDSKVNIDYITYKNKEGKIEVLSCNDGNSLNTFIKNHYFEIATLSEEEIFNYLKENVLTPVSFDNKELYQEYKDHEPIVNNTEIENEEIKTLDEYKSRFQINDKTEIAVDRHGERLYRVGTGLYKFKTNNGNRELVVLEQPIIKEEENTNGQEQVDEIAAVNEFNTEKNITVNNNEPIIYNREKLVYLINKKFIYETELTLDENEYLLSAIEYLVDHMDEITSKYGENEDYSILEGFMESKSNSDNKSIIEKYDEIKEGLLPDDALSNKEKRIVDKYYSVISKAQENIKNNSEVQTRKLIVDNNSGIGLLLVVLEIAIIAVIILLVLTIDI